MKNANFIAIDFETATASTQMPCQIGIAVVRDGEICERIRRYIRPPQNKYSPKCIEVHGITPDITKNEPEFDSVWEDIKGYFNANFIVAHNYSFDSSVLEKALDRYNIPHPIFMGTCCTYALTDLPLSDACEALGVELQNHHDALDDAVACAELFLKYLRGETANLIKQAKEHRDRPDRRPVYHERIRGEYLEKDLDNVENKDNPFYNKKVVITGVFESMSRNEIAEKLQSLGADVDTCVSSKMKYLIAGANYGPSKMAKIKKFQQEGFDIEVLSEEELMKML